jgi:hypothetical protein
LLQVATGMNLTTKYNLLKSSFVILWQDFRNPCEAERRAAFEESSSLKISSKILT